MSIFRLNSLINKVINSFDNRIIVEMSLNDLLRKKDD